MEGNTGSSPPSFILCLKQISFCVSTHFSHCGETYNKKYIVYVTDGNIMYLTDASRFLISCVMLCTCGGVEEQMHNVDYDPGP